MLGRRAVVWNRQCFNPRNAYRTHPVGTEPLAESRAPSHLQLWDDERSPCTRARNLGWVLGCLLHVEQNPERWCPHQEEPDSDTHRSLPARLSQGKRDAARSAHTAGIARSTALLGPEGTRTCRPELPSRPR